MIDHDKVDHYGQVLRACRVAAGWTQHKLASLANVSQPTIANVESGSRRLHVDVATACDQALGTAPLLALLATIESGDAVQRRSVIRAATLVGVTGAPTFGEILRRGLMDTAMTGTDWEATTEDYTRRMVLAPSEEYGASLEALLIVLEGQLTERATIDRLRAMAHLGHLYGMHCGNTGDLRTAHGWYRTAVTLADQTSDTESRAYLRARSAVRGSYEGYSVTTTLDYADEALSLAPRAPHAALEAHAAKVHVYALTGQVTEGRQAANAMKDLAEELPDGPAGPRQRAASFASYLACRIGSRRDAEREYWEAEPILRTAPTWYVDAAVYYGRALVRHGDIEKGVSYALAQIRTLRHRDWRMLRVGVRDLASIVPDTYHSDELDELRGYASPDPGPWETLKL